MFRVIGLSVSLFLMLLAPSALAQTEFEKAFAEFDIVPTTGAAAGYVPDSTCALCHGDKAESFSHVAMSKSFYRPSPDNVIEDFTNSHYFHEPSGRHYEMELRDGEYVFRRYMIAADGTRIHEIEQKVDWILGSGNHSRIYIYRTADGSMFELPLSWYSQEGEWRMAPGFEWPRHLGVMRTVPRQCMFCHNAYPQVERGSDRLGLPETFPAELPQGIGCQRCHGPGASHAGLALSGESDFDILRAAIVNPARLTTRQLYSICYGCHMQPAVAVVGVRRFGRNAYSFRPGEVLSQFRADMDMTERNRTKEDRFEINHHPYRLEQSECFTKSEGRLGCLTCHDLHVKVPKEDRADHYRTACLTCHETGATGLPVMKTAGTEHPAITGDADCTTCHMPKRRTQDVIHVTMTDHRITRDPGAGDLTATIEKKDPEIERVDLLNDDHGLEPDEAVMMKAIAVLRVTGGRSPDAGEALGRLLAANPHPEFEPWYELGSAMMKQGDFTTALAVIDEARKRTGPHVKLEEMRAVSLFSTGREEEGIAALHSLIADYPDEPIIRFRLALMLQRTGDSTAAIREAEKVLELRHNHWPAWWLIGRIAAGEGRHEDAVAALLKAAAIEPADPRTREALIASLKALGREEEAARY